MVGKGTSGNSYLVAAFILHKIKLQNFESKRYYSRKKREIMCFKLGNLGKTEGHNREGMKLN